MSTCSACKGKGKMQGRACKRASVIGSKKRAALGIGRKAWVISNAIWSQGSWPICCYCTWHGPLTCSDLMMLPRGQGFMTFNILRLNLFACKHIHNIQKEQTNSIQKYKTWKYGSQHSPCCTHILKYEHTCNKLFSRHQDSIPAPMTSSIFTVETSISFANSRTASLGSS